MINDLFVLEVTGTDESGKMQTVFKATGNKPSFFEEAQRSGVKMPENLFEVNDE